MQKIRISYFEGWSLLHNLNKKIKKNFEITIDNSYKIIYLPDPVVLSYGNGPTIPISIYRLNDDNTISYYWEGKFLNWNHSIPTWEKIS